MANDLIPTETTIAGLPVPPQEKVARWLVHASVLGLGVAGVITFMPFIIKALMLLVSATWGVAGLLTAFAVVCALGVAIMYLGPVYKLFMEGLASRLTWKVLNYDPVAHILLWFKQVRQDRIVLEGTYTKVDTVIAQLEQTVEDNRTAAKKGDLLVAEAARRYGENDPRTVRASIKPSALINAAKDIEKKIEEVRPLRELLLQVVEAARLTEEQAEAELASARQILEASESLDSATDAANRALGTSAKKQNAMDAMKIIHGKYAASFGRVRSLRQLSQKIIEGADLTKGMYHTEALERLRREGSLLLNHAPAQIEATKIVGKDGAIAYY